MSEEEELERIRQRKLQELQQQAIQQQMAEQQQNDFERKKGTLILTFIPRSLIKRELSVSNFLDKFSASGVSLLSS